MMDLNAPTLIETARLELHRPQPEYAPLVFEAYAQDSEVTRYLGWRPHLSLDDARQAMEDRLQEWDSGREFSWFIFERASNQLIGSISARMEGSRVNLGYVLARSSWGQGFMTEAAAAVVSWAFSLPEIYRVWALCDVDNAASARVLEKVGMTREGTLKQFGIHPNISAVPRDCYSYAVTRDEYDGLPEMARPRGD
jgi:[ribosomal protein S5]-alanine N-acetyltransferase